MCALIQLDNLQSNFSLMDRGEKKKGERDIECGDEKTNIVSAVFVVLY